MDTRILWGQLLDFFGFHNHTSDQEREIINRSDDKKIISIYKRQGFRIVVHCPDSFTEVQDIVDQLKLKKPIILNLEAMERELARRIIDFISRAVYGIDGNVQKISDAIFIFTPNNIHLDDQLLKKNKSLFR